MRAVMISQLHSVYGRAIFYTMDVALNRGFANIVRRILSGK